MPFHEKNSLKIYLADSFPVPVCRNIRIRRCKIYQDECFRGRVSSRKEYFYGLKVHALMTESGIPVEIFLSPGSYSDTNSLYDFSFPVPSGSVVYGDKAYNAYNIEDEAQAVRHSSESCQKEKFKKKIRVIYRRWSQIHPKAHRISIQRHHPKISSAYSCCHLAWL
ncbi:hypothetical protein LDFHOB_05940 [Candidatus Electronema aureum]